MTSTASPPALRLLFFGTPLIAVPTLEGLIAGPHQVVGVISQPDRPRGRGRKESASPVAAVALREKIPLFRPERVGDAETVKTLNELRPDAGVVVAFGQFLPKKVRELPRCGYLINAHASLLPKYRGASPIAQAILDGEAETGVSVMRVDREMDAGPVALVVRTPIEPQETTAELSERLSELASRAVDRAVDLIARDAIEWTEQDASLATVAPKLDKSDSILDLRESAVSLARRVHALSPKPGGALTLVSDRDAPSKEIGLKLSRATVMPFERTSAAATPAPRIGTIERGNADDDFALRIATGDGWLVPLTIQRAGGKPLPTADFLRGFALPGDARCALPDADQDATP